MDDLQPDEVRHLLTLPPFAYNYDDILVKHFGSTTSKDASMLLTDLLQVYKKYEEKSDEEEEDT